MSLRHSWDAALRGAVRPNRLVRNLSGAAVLWARLADDGSPASFVHRTFQREIWRESGAGGKLLLGAGFAAWLPLTLALAAGCTRRLGPAVRAATGKGLARQAREQLALAFGSAVPPPWYYHFEFHDDAKRRAALRYLYRFETKVALYHFLRRQLSSAETTEALRDKAAFAQRCRAHGLPVVAALATADAGHIERLDGGGPGLPHGDLFLKPLRGAGGRGAERWLWRGDGTYEGAAGAVRSEAELAAHLEELSRAEPQVVRAYARNHPALRDLSPSALSTVRVLSCLDEDGRPEVTHAVLRMARAAEALVDNFHQGGAAARVDLRTGELGRATSLGWKRDTGWWDAHPLTGAAITGRKLPYFEEVLDVARRAHAAFADQVAIGWDVAILPEGPALVEGNKSPDLDIVQRTHGEPIGDSRFGALFAFHLRRALAAKYGSAQ
jgi:hypothetical protein